MADRMMAEFLGRKELAAAIRALRERGYRRLNAYTPYQAEEVEEALGFRRSRLPFAVFVVGIGAAAGAFFLQWFLVAYLYPLNVGGRPPYFPLAFVLITFEMGILFAAFTAFFGVLALGRLVRLIDIPQATPGFETASGDRFWLQIEERDAAFDWDRSERELRDLGALRVESPRLPS